MAAAEATLGWHAMKEAERAAELAARRNTNAAPALIDDVARALAKEGSNLRSMPGLTAISDEAAKLLVPRIGGNLPALKALSTEVAKALSQSGHHLVLNGVTTLSDEAAKALTERDRRRECDTALTPEIGPDSSNLFQTQRALFSWGLRGGLPGIGSPSAPPNHSRSPRAALPPAKARGSSLGIRSGWAPRDRCSPPIPPHRTGGIDRPADRRSVPPAPPARSHRGAAARGARGRTRRNRAPP